MQNLRQIVDNETESAGEHLGTDLFELPTRQIEVNTIQECRIVILFRQFLEQVGVFQHVRHVMRGVAYERHARLALERLDATGERLVGHVVLHDVHQVPAGLLGLACELVERHRIPIAHKPQMSVGIVHEQFGHCHFPAGYEHAVRREFRVDVRLAGAFRPEFDQIVVSFHKRHHAYQMQQFSPVGE